MLILSRKVGETVYLNEDIEIKIVEVSGDKVRLGIEAPKDVKVLRSELRQTLLRLTHSRICLVRSRSDLNNKAGAAGKSGTPALISYCIVSARRPFLCCRATPYLHCV